MSDKINIYDPYGNKMTGTVRDGKTYLADGSRLPTGYTSETAGGLYTMGSDGRGFKVDSIPRKEYTPKQSQPRGQMPQAQGKNASNVNRLLEALAGSMSQGPNYNEMMEQIMGSMPQYQLPEIMSHEEGQRLAGDQINPVFEKGLKDSMEQVDRNALKSGFFGQLPTVDRKGKIAGDLELEKSGALATLANQLVGQSKDDAYRQADFSRTQQMDKLNTLMSALQSSQMAQQNKQQGIGNLISLMTGIDRDQFDRSFTMMDYGDKKSMAERQYKDSRVDTGWQKGITEAQLTGVFKNQPTMAFKQLSHTIGMDEKKMEMADKQFNQAVTEFWERNKNDKIALGQAGARIGLQSKAQDLTLQKFITATKESAYHMTTDYFTQQGRFPVNQQQQDVLSNLLGDGYGPEADKGVGHDEFNNQLEIYMRMLLSNDENLGIYGDYQK